MIMLSKLEKIMEKNEFKKMMKKENPLVSVLSFIK